jgi:hypothetical protein
MSTMAGVPVCAVSGFVIVISLVSVPKQPVLYSLYVGFIRMFIDLVIMMGQDMAIRLVRMKHRRLGWTLLGCALVLVEIEMANLALLLPDALIFLTSCPFSTSGFLLLPDQTLTHCV